MMPLKKTGRRAERRQQARADAHLSMRVEAPPTDGQLTHIVTESENISSSGVYCYSPNYLAPLSKVALTIVLPRVPGRGSERLLKCEGVVVRCLAGASKAKERQYQMACSFLGLEPRHRELLDEFVTWRNLQSLRRAGTAAGTAARAPAKRKATTRRTRTTRTTRTTTRASERAGSRGKAATRSRRTIH
jgi:c-di-GMP-binding flagellar brake protein YcgR